MTSEEQSTSGTSDQGAWQATAGSTEPDDLGSTGDDPGLTAGGMGTGIDEAILTGDETSPSDLGMGMDDTSGYVSDEGA